MTDERPDHPLYGPSPREAERESLLEDAREGRAVFIRMGDKRMGRPWLTYALLVVIVLVYGVWFIDPAAYEQMVLWGGLSWQPVVEDGQWWRIVTAIFLHVDLVHLAMNGLTLFFIGQMREHMDGRLRYVLLFFIAGIGGNLVQLAVSDRESWAIGASGALFGLMGVEVMFLGRHQNLMQGGRARWLELLALLGLQVGLGLAVSDRIGNGAHLGGLAIGLFWAWCYGPLYRVPPQPPFKNDDGFYEVQAVETLPLSRGRWGGVALLIGGLLIGAILLLLLA